MAFVNFVTVGFVVRDVEVMRNILGQRFLLG